MRAEKIDDTDEYLKIKVTIIQVKINNKPNFNEIPIRTPKKVATPFPPLKFSHTGNKCPKNASNPER